MLTLDCATCVPMLQQSDSKMHFLYSYTVDTTLDAIQPLRYSSYFLLMYRGGTMMIAHDSQSRLDSTIPSSLCT